MKKPDPQHPINKLSLVLWEQQRRLEEMTDEDKILQECKDGLNVIHKKQLAKKVQKIIKGLGLTKKQLKVFTSYVDTGSYRQTARELTIDHAYAIRIIQKIQELVKTELNRSPLVHK